MHRPAPNIYTGPLIDMTASIVADLKKVARTEHAVAMYICNGHGAWEAALSNVLSRGDEVLVLESGRFAPGWGLMAEALGVAVQTLDGPPRGAVDPERVEAWLRADTERRIRALLVVQVDTAAARRGSAPRLPTPRP